MAKGRVLLPGSELLRQTRSFVHRWGALFAAWGAFGCGEASLVSAEPELVGGDRAREGDFPSVFVWTSEGVALDESYCTATKVGETFVLTAAHCVLEQEETPGRSYAGRWHRTGDVANGQNIKLSFARHLTSAARQETLRIRAIHLPPALERCVDDRASDARECSKGRTPLPDVALLDVEPAGTFAEAPASPVDFKTIRAGNRITMLGYGAHRDNDTTKPWLRYHGASVASSEALHRALVGSEADLDGFPDDALFFGTLGVLIDSANANLGSGDSGGPVFDSNGAVVGINSDGFCPKTNRNCQRTTNSLFARIDRGAPHGVGDWLSDRLR